VATPGREPQLRRRLPVALPGALTLALLAGPVLAQYQPSGYQPLQGEPFFLLSDRAWGTWEVAQVRLEVVGGRWGMGEVERAGGVDVALYRVPRPLAFLEQQRNLHRVRVEGLHQEEGVANAVAHVWDRWFQASRLAWRGLFSTQARLAVTGEAPELKTSPALRAPTRFEHAPQWKPLPGFQLVEHFRYPGQRARPIEPPRDVKLSGSSSEFIAPSPGNVMVPLGRLEAGLYLAEASVGSYRATALVFVADTVAVTKTSAGELLVWAAQRGDGHAVPGVQVAWSDGTGVLARGTTDGSGLLRLVHEAPERSYVFGVDTGGGVFVSEGFYYDSEIHDTKLYAFTDRPLYRPGDQVFVKFLGREFLDARSSRPIAGGQIALSVIDPGGATVASQKLIVSPDAGGDTSFRLPENATGGGYELRFSYAGGSYGAAFRVAEYQKPHFEITVVPDRPGFKTREPISGRLQLRYPDGKPVRGARIDLSVRAQQLTMVDGDLGYYGQFPVKLSAEALTSDASGEARFTLPAAEQPSRYLLTLFATDGAAYRVKTTRELLVERGPGAFTLRAERGFSAPGEQVAFTLRALGTGPVTPASWTWIRLEDRARASGSLASPERLELAFPRPGSYTVELRDAHGDLLGATSHRVSGDGARPTPGSIEIVPSQERAVPGQSIDLLISFAEPVQEALLTLERDRVEQTALLGTARGWVEARQVAPTQWRATVPVRADFAPSITFSVAYVRNGEYVFQNQGLLVEQPRVEVALRPDREVVAPGESVEVEVVTRLAGQPVAASVTVSVVDEMIYALQPELAPDVHDFFFHPRRNNVRTAASLSFIGYDLAASRTLGAPQSHAVNERRVKVLERPRREDVDTAAWQPTLRTDGRGRARFRFTMPDSLTRWRITGRAVAGDGSVGQRTTFLRSDKELYVKWTSPTWMRQGDAPLATIAVFNQTTDESSAELSVEGPGLATRQALRLKPGVTYVAQALGELQGDGALRLTLRRGGQVVDALETGFARTGASWPSPRSLDLDVTASSVPLSLPPDARKLRVTFTSSARAELRRVIDDLLEYPYGCIEQTASRMIPFALAIDAVPPDQPELADRLRQQLHGQRLRLAYLAGPKATFTWWGVGTGEDPLLTAYAYHADWIALRALGLQLPAEHWSRLLDVYSEGGHRLPLLQRALVLGWMQEMDLPVQGPIEALVADLEPSRAGAWRELGASTSLVMADTQDGQSRAIALVLAGRLAGRAGLALPTTLSGAIESAAARLSLGEQPFARAALIAAGRLPTSEARATLRLVSAQAPTLERAVTLVWLQRALVGEVTVSGSPVQLAGGWQQASTLSGTVQWRWPARQPLPAELRLAQPPPQGLVAVVQFESAAPEAPSLGASVQRRLFRLRPSAPGFDPEPVPAGAPLSSDELYLDEVVLRPAPGRSLRHALLEVPLPPGASVESTTWGVQVRGTSGFEALERARAEVTSWGYAVPLDPLGSPTTVRHLLRFAQKGRFGVPPARLQRMYEPEARALEADAARIWEVQ
jgi:uncharacterized protein YfaS (alpha-2-macroglobulin family)